MRNVLIGALLGIVGVLGALYAIGQTVEKPIERREAPPAEAAPAEPEPEPAAPAEPAQPPRRLRSEVTDPAQLAILHQAVIEAGFTCPRLAMAWNHGMKPRGVEIKARCGPETGGVMPDLTYRVTIRNDDRVAVEPWE